MTVSVDEIYARLDEAVRQRDIAWQRMDALKDEFDALPWWRLIRKEKKRDAVIQAAVMMRYWNEIVDERISQCEILEALGADDR